MAIEQSLIGLEGQIASTYSSISIREQRVSVIQATIETDDFVETVINDPASSLELLKEQEGLQGFLDQERGLLDSLKSTARELIQPHISPAMDYLDSLELRSLQLEEFRTHHQAGRLTAELMGRIEANYEEFIKSPETNPELGATIRLIQLYPELAETPTEPESTSFEDEVIPGINASLDENKLQPEDEDEEEEIPDQDGETDNEFPGAAGLKPGGAPSYSPDRETVRSEYRTLVKAAITSISQYPFPEEMDTATLTHRYKEYFGRTIRESELRRFNGWGFVKPVRKVGNNLYYDRSQLVVVKILTDKNKRREGINKRELLDVRDEEMRKLKESQSK